MNKDEEEEEEEEERDVCRQIFCYAAYGGWCCLVSYYIFRALHNGDMKLPKCVQIIILIFLILFRGIHNGDMNPKNHFSKNN